MLAEPFAGGGDEPSFHDRSPSACGVCEPDARTIAICPDWHRSRIGFRRSSHSCGADAEGFSRVPAGSARSPRPSSILS
ncbi:hypothetical protein AvCA_05720 [Azotobacter vinelandii CA]|uniref:Uncharacterized protein n=2 Tax=Azotobacter vinelandii TaxID=354 RepID=C1DKG2_AZOVD|nr:hypothetical protein Avin_05720 [Azotobacter vinelandii DJ]AGK15571.1 hypothetical protein AvCA_05720 [Azotobacter vinelandii CA]AGK19397.1 hypothetical protein AvCA6_05720 [Azotobacter vinelandii CA6]